MCILNCIKRLSLLIAIITLAGCGENLFSLTNKTLLDQMTTDLAYIQDNCALVIKNLEEKQLTLDLSVEEKYQYVSSLLSCSGFDVRASLAIALGPDNAPDEEKDDPLDVMYSFINKDTFTLDIINDLTDTYSKALLQCTGRMNNNLRIICTLIGGASNTVAVTKELLFIFARPSIPANQSELKAILIDIAGSSSVASAYLIEKTEAIYPSMFIEDPDFESRLVRSSNAIQIGLSTLESLVGNSSGTGNNLLIGMLDTISDTILNPGGLGMARVMSIILLEMLDL